MYSKHHFVLSVLAGAALLPAVDTGLGSPVVVAYAAALGVGIDFDHFVVARLNTGSWRALREVAANPTRPFVAQDEIFLDGEVGTLNRLLSHALIAGILVGVLLAIDATGLADGIAAFDEVDASALAVVSAVVLYVHVLSDLAWDVRHEASSE